MLFDICAINIIKRNAQNPDQRFCRVEPRDRVRVMA